MSTIQAPRKITLAQFGPWLAKHAGAEFSSHSQRVDCVVGIGHIEPGKFVALYAIRVKTGLMIFELSEYYDNQAEA